MTEREELDEQKKEVNEIQIANGCGRKYVRRPEKKIVWCLDGHFYLNLVAHQIFGFDLRHLTWGFRTDRRTYSMFWNSTKIILNRTESYIFVTSNSHDSSLNIVVLILSYAYYCYFKILNNVNIQLLYLRVFNANYHFNHFTIIIWTLFIDLLTTCKLRVNVYPFIVQIKIFHISAVYTEYFNKTFES